MTDHTEVMRLARLRHDELAIEQRRLARLLGRYRAFSHFAVLAGIIIPVLAGSGLVAEGGLLFDLKPALAIAVIVTAMLTALHKGLNCEAFHADCRRAINTLQSLVEGYEAVAASHDPAGAVEALEARLRQFRATAFDVPPLRQRQRSALAATP